MIRTKVIQLVTKRLLSVHGNSVVFSCWIWIVCFLPTQGTELETSTTGTDLIAHIKASSSVDVVMVDHKLHFKLIQCFSKHKSLLMWTVW